MKKISQKDIKGLKKSGARVVAQDPPAEIEPVKSAEPAEIEVPHASMAASMEASSAQHEATQQLIARNTEVVAGFAEDVRKLTSKQKAAPAGAPNPWAEGATHDIVRDKDNLLKRVYSRPGILLED